MSNIDKQALREAAEKATHGEWLLEYGEDGFDGDDALIQCEVQGRIPVARIEGAHPESGFDADFQQEQQANAEFIAAASPATVLALLDELEEAEYQRDNIQRVNCGLFEKLTAAEKRIAELEVRAFNPALLDVISERQRQRAVEGWTPEQDDHYTDGELAAAACCYAYHGFSRQWLFNQDAENYRAFAHNSYWPWKESWWKPKSPRQDLVRATALLLAEIERLDRQTAHREATK